MKRDDESNQLLAVETVPGIGRRYELTDLDRGHLAVIMLPRGGCHLAIRPSDNEAPTAVARLGEQQARLLALILAGLAEPRAIEGERQSAPAKRLAASRQHHPSPIGGRPAAVATPLARPPHDSRTSQSTGQP
jgi:K+/H+ antiporter YhaU regulatory subunit KhtT